MDKNEEKALRFVETIKRIGLDDAGVDAAILELLSDDEIQVEDVPVIKQYLIDILVDEGMIELVPWSEEVSFEEVTIH